MANKYNAFISYRHAPEDIKIASEVQKSLERFKIPPEIQKKTGIKRFERIFRDKEELPITSDLNDNIDEAIKNSDNLIVICSTRTGESIWVRKEIETFLKYHPKKNIFTVLVDGEPGDVIPDLLLHDTVTTTKPDGNTETREILIEPLSCDYRIGIKKARKVELPRLAASLLDCSYDELVQRRRQYERRRNAMIATASTCAGLCIMAYLIWSLLQIRMNYDLAQSNYELAQNNYAMAQANLVTAQENYAEALNNQSKYLATVSGQYLDGGERVTATLLALAALPSEGNERPVTTRAEYALANALGSYLPPGAYAMEPVWEYNTSYDIEKYLITQDQTKLIAMDTSGDVTIWNLADHSIYTVIPCKSREITDMVINREGILVINYNDRLVAYDDSYENIIWSYDIDSDHVSNSGRESLRFIAGGSEVMFKPLTGMMIFDALTGEVELDFDINVVLPVDYGKRNVYMLRANSDGRYVAVESAETLENKTISVYDRELDTWTDMNEELWSAQDMCFTPDDRLIVAYEKEYPYLSSYSMGSMELLTRSTRTFSMFDIGTGKKIWSEDVSYTLSSMNTKFHFVDYSVSGEPVSALAVLFSNKYFVLELETGKLLSEDELTGEYIASYLTSADDGLVTVLRNGKYLYTPFSDEQQYVASYNYLLENITDAMVYNSDDDSSCFLVKYKDNTGLIEYKMDFHDHDYTEIEGLETGVTMRSGMQAGDKILLFGTDMSLYCYDSSSGSIDWKTTVEGDSYTSVKLLCYGGDGIAYMSNRNRIGDDSIGEKLFAINISDGSITRVEGVPYGTYMVFDHTEDKIYISASYTDDLPSGLYVYDMTTHTSECVDVTGDDVSLFGSGDIWVSPDEKKLICIPFSYYAEDAYAYIIDLETGESVKQKCNLNAIAEWAPDSDKYALGDGLNVCLYDLNHDPVANIRAGDSEIIAITYCEKGLITLSKLNKLSLYDYDGVMMGSIQLRNIVGFSREDISFAIYDDEDLFVTLGEYSFVINLEEFELQTYLCGLLSYDHENRMFYIKNYDKYEDIAMVLCYKRLTVEELIEKGRQYVGDSVLSDELKKMLGIR